MTYILGIDEAGRGPIIGPLVMAVAAIEEEKEKSLRPMGVKDSKLLTEKQREEILEHLIVAVKYEVIQLEPRIIDDALNSENSNLNWLEADNQARLINIIDDRLEHNISKAYIDCPSTNISAYKNYLAEKISNKKIKLIVEHKADFNYLIVGAASIIAKVTREKSLEFLRKKLNVDFGSGYPADPKTKEFIAKNHKDQKYSSIIRKTWSTYKNLASSGKQKRLGEY